MSLTFKSFEHKCSTVKETFPPRNQDEGCFVKLKRLWFSLVLISTKNSLTLEHYSSEFEVKNEQRRQYYSSNFFIIHPLSKMSAVIDVYLCIFYFHAIFYKLIDVAFLRRQLMGTARYATIVSIINAIDILSWINLISSFFQGAVLKKNVILIDFRRIVLYRLTSFHFWAEFLSSVPKCMICYKQGVCAMSVWFSLSFFRLFIIFLCLIPIHLLKQTLRYLKIDSRRVLIITHLLYIMTFVTHLMACTGFAISRYRHAITGIYANNTWILYKGLIHRNLPIQYGYAFFKASAQTFGITISEFDESANWEDNVMSSINFVLGRVIFLIMWVAILHVLLAKDLQETRFEEIVSQLKTWMENRDLPKKLQKRVVDYYNFYYRKRFFSRRQVQKLIPESLAAKMKINMHKTLKESHIALFSKLSDEEMRNISEHFVTEIYSPNDVIIYSGTKGDALFLLASGTVAVYSHSGKEVCHLHDGAYFGELALLMNDQRISATIVAVETTKIYKIARNYFEQYILSKKELYDMFLKKAEKRLQKITRVEEEYQRTLFAEMYKKKE